ncbi:N-acetylmuramoyl-L-alanine amidase [Bacillaceae bacterium IKA-2]|nr:N-acetylmuramoyl-L-alanine amidase [Bacillaceae bacterium IKA-2]
MKSSDVQVQLSRKTDTFVELSERARMANAWGANYFCSIHINAGGGDGYEDYIHSTLSDTSTTAQYQKIMNEEIVKTTGFRNRGTKKANFVVLRETAMSAILTENGFIDNTSNAQLLKDPAFIECIARGHVNGFARIFNFQKKTPVEKDIYRIFVDNIQIQDLSNKENILNIVSEHLGVADLIELKKVQ